MWDPATCGSNIKREAWIKDRILRPDIPEGRDVDGGAAAVDPFRTGQHHNSLNNPDSSGMDPARTGHPAVGDNGPAARTRLPAASTLRPWITATALCKTTITNNNGNPRKANRGRMGQGPSRPFVPQDPGAVADDVRERAYSHLCLC